MNRSTNIEENQTNFNNRENSKTILTEDSQIAKDSGDRRKDLMNDDYYDTREEYYLDSVTNEEDKNYESYEEDNALKKEINSFFPFSSLFESDNYDELDNTVSKVENVHGMDVSPKLDILVNNQEQFKGKPSYLKNEASTNNGNDYKTYDTWNSKKPKAFSFEENELIKNILPQRNGARRNGFSDWIKDFERRYL